jgi:hypothetical protein
MYVMYFQAYISVSVLFFYSNWSALRNYPRQINNQKDTVLKQAVSARYPKGLLAMKRGLYWHHAGSVRSVFSGPKPVSLVTYIAQLSSVNKGM